MQCIQELMAQLKDNLVMLVRNGLVNSDRKTQTFKNQPLEAQSYRGKSMEGTGLAAMLVAKSLAGVAPEVNLEEYRFMPQDLCLHQIQIRLWNSGFATHTRYYQWWFQN